MRAQSTIHPRTGQGRASRPSCRIPAILAAALVLGGCAATHVGDAWQCPLAQGAACTSVAEADPAVAAPGKAQGLAIRTPLYRPETGDAGGSDAPATKPNGDTPCGGGCDPLAWLAKWFGTGQNRDDGAAPAEPEPVSPDEGSPDEANDRLRTKESIARIWIAPFVDADGVYREAHWVRAVLEPARWRLP